MQPEMRCYEAMFSIPKFDIQQDDIKGFMNELIGFHELFKDCFARSEFRQHFFRYMSIQLSQLERKSIATIALAVEKGRVRAMQRFVSEAYWNEDKILSKYKSLVKGDLGNEEGVLIFDGCNFVKKGENSIRVNKQDCGSVGKVENCQVGVFATHGSGYGDVLLDK